MALWLYHQRRHRRPPLCYEVYGLREEREESRGEKGSKVSSPQFCHATDGEHQGAVMLIEPTM
ncbi:MAG: hypothetical protein AAB342_02835, partial [Chloroflexota bacterium]